MKLWNQQTKKVEKGREYLGGELSQDAFDFCQVPFRTSHAF